MSRDPPWGEVSEKFNFLLCGDDTRLWPVGKPCIGGRNSWWIFAELHDETKQTKKAPLLLTEGTNGLPARSGVVNRPRRPEAFLPLGRADKPKRS